MFLQTCDTPSQIIMENKKAFEEEEQKECHLLKPVVCYRAMGPRAFLFSRNKNGHLLLEASLSLVLLPRCQSCEGTHVTWGQKEEKSQEK